MNSFHESAGVTDIGGRENNEDAFVILAAGRLIVVADGMGGHAGGDQASAQAIATVTRLLSELDLERLEKLSTEEQSSSIRAFLLGMIQQANADIQALNEGAQGRNRMGTTLTLVFVGAKTLHFAWVGDSRVYILRDSQLLQLTDDHTINYELYRLGQMTKSELRACTSGRGSHIITRSLGVGTVEADYQEEPLLGDELLLCCSDGLNNSVPHAVLTETLVAGGTAEAISKELMRKALEANASDNVTAIVTKLPKRERKSKFWSFLAKVAGF